VIFAYFLCDLCVFFFLLFSYSVIEAYCFVYSMIFFILSAFLVHISALVYPVLSLEITTCFLLVMPLVSPTYSCSIFLPLMLLLPFLHRSYLIFIVSVFQHFLRSFGGYSSFCYMSSSSAAFASSSAWSYPGMPMCPGTHRSVICFLFWSIISLSFIVFGFLV
jgi:hypothetical protein